MDKLAQEQGTALWNAFLEDAATSLSSHVFDTWMAPIQCRAYTGGTLHLEVRDRFFRDWLHDHYVDFLRDGLAAKAGESVAIELHINPQLGGEETDEAPEPADEKTDKVTVADGMDLAAERKRHLNPRYVFDSFVAGPSNEFAFAACKAVAEKPGTSYNPLFIFGGVGLGKTHLLSAIGQQILKDKPHTRIVYTSSEQFTNDVINAVLGNKLEEFRAKYRRDCDCILIDDIQLIAGKERTQHEFFHIFNTLYDSQRQIVVTSDRLPHEIPDIEERLRNRFQWGLIADIQPPEIETRIAILRKKAAADGVHLDDDVTFFLAKTIRSNVRELEGALVRVVAHASLTRSEITVEYARQVLADIISGRDQKVSVESVQKIVAGYYQLRVADLKSRRRQKTLVRPRQVAMYLARKHAGSSFPDLGSRFGDKDHTTIMSACKKIDSLLKSDPDLRSQVLDIERRLDLPEH